ncbi:MAG: DUF1599 domain-containing protein [Bacteroidota bacterium]
MKDTNTAYQDIISTCKALFIKKAKDYGVSWRIFRMSSVTDQIYIKAERLRTLEETQQNLVGDSVEGEYMGIINYSLIALMLLEWQNQPSLNETQVLDTLEASYDKHVSKAFQLMQQKNHDYGEAWRKIRMSSITDLILAKLLRLKQIEDNKGKLVASEGEDANYMDILNYAVFALIRLGERGVLGGG